MIILLYTCRCLKFLLHNYKFKIKLIKSVTAFIVEKSVLLIEMFQIILK